MVVELYKNKNGSSCVIPVGFTLMVCHLYW